MRTIVKKFWLTFTTLIVFSISAQAQVKGPSETKKQAETEIRTEQKREKERKRRSEKVASEEISELNTSPKYKKIVRKKEKQLLKPVVVTKERKK